MVKDNVTGLIWEVKTDDDSIHDKDDKYTWADTASFIGAVNAANFGGFWDWRLPTIKELMSIVNSDAIAPTIDTDYFPNTVNRGSHLSSHYWSSNTYAFYPMNAWSVDFNYGDVNCHGRDKDGSVWCVRGGHGHDAY